MCGDDRGRIRFQSGKSIGNCPTLLVETLPIPEAIIEAIRANLSKVIIESDSQVAIRAIIGDIKLPSDVSNIVVDICLLLTVVMNLKFLHYNRKLIRMPT